MDPTHIIVGHYLLVLDPISLKPITKLTLHHAESSIGWLKIHADSDHRRWNHTCASISLPHR